MLSKELLACLVCPLTKEKLIYDEAAKELISKTAGLAFPIRDDIPVLLLEDARRLDIPHDEVG